jgi:hypothetical protein
MLELFIDNKKSLTMRKSPLLLSSEMLDFSFGTPEKFDIRTFKKKLSMVDLEELREFHKFIKN